MEKLIILGTGNAQAFHCFNTCFALKTEDGVFLTDTGGGNGILKQLDSAGIAIQDIHNIFISHEHTDHILGVVWMIRMTAAAMLNNKYEGSLHIYCHAKLVDTIDTITRLTVQGKFYKLIGERIFLVPLESGESKEIMGYHVTFFDIGSTKAKQFGYTLTLHSGKKFTCLGDEPYKEEFEKPYAENADWLLCEAFCRYEDREIFHPYEKHHATVKEACELAQQLRVKNLLLYHTEDKHLSTRRETYTKEGSRYYTGNLLVPDDLDIIDLNNGSVG